MARSVTITIEDDIEAAELLNNFCIGFGYDADRDGTKIEFYKKVIIEYTRERAKHGEKKTNDQILSDKYNGMSII